MPLRTVGLVCCGPLTKDFSYLLPHLSNLDVVLAKPVHMETLHRLLKNCNTLGTTSPLFIDDNVVSFAC
jgi:hypothetical protein